MRDEGRTIESTSFKYNVHSGKKKQFRIFLIYYNLLIHLCIFLYNFLITNNMSRYQSVLFYFIIYLSFARVIKCFLLKSLAKVDPIWHAHIC